MKFDMPKALFSGLALIAAAIYFGPGSQPVDAAGDLNGNCVGVREGAFSQFDGNLQVVQGRLPLPVKVK